ncbi:MAG: metal-dependent transcriptional regulator [Chloroflexota bacterium]
MATPTIEEYLEAIYLMEVESPPVRSARVAEAMGVSAPTVTDTLRRMAQQGYVLAGQGRGIALTDRGRELAEALVRRHRLSERWLVDVLGFDWSRAHEEACRLEHAISQEVEARLALLLEYPTTCPHGNPIPGLSAGSGEDVTPLSRAAAGDEVTVVRLSPLAETEPDLLEYLHRSGLVPGAGFRLQEVAPAAEVVTLRGPGGVVSLGSKVAAMVWVRISRQWHSS